MADVQLASMGAPSSETAGDGRAAVKCPKCGRGTYSKKFDQCSACLDEKAISVTPKRISVTIPVRRGRPPKDGALSNAERQRIYRARKKVERAGSAQPVS